MNPYPPSARAVIDLTRPPYNLDPTGERDCSAGLIRAIDDGLRRVRDGFRLTREAIESGERERAGFESRRGFGTLFPHETPPARILFLPPGLYRLAHPVAHGVDGLTNDFGMELSRGIRLVGAGRDVVTLRMDDGHPAFQGASPAPVLAFMRGRRSNVAMSNFLKGLTVDTGRDNPGAIAVDFFANNNGALRDVRLRSGDSSGIGHAGLAISRELVSGVFVRGLAVEGFDYGVAVRDTRIFTVFEDIRIRGQRKAGFRVGDNVVSLRRLQSENAVPAVRMEGPLGHLVLLDSELSGGSADAPAVDFQGGQLFVRNVGCSGYGVALRRADGYGMAGPFPDLYVSGGGACTAPEQAARSLGLPVEAVPEPASVAGASVCVDDFGAAGDGERDDAPAIQAALHSGAAEVVFQPARYRLDAPVDVPASVERIRFLFCDLVAGPGLREAGERGAFRIVDDSETPLFLEDLFAWEEWHGRQRLIEHACRRTLVLRDLHVQTGALYFNTVSGGRVFLENVSCTDPVGHRCARFTGQQVWARQFNPERGAPAVTVDGGALWLMGFKTEENGIAFEVRNGGRLEVLGGVVNCYGTSDSAGRIDPDTPIVRATDAEASLVAATSGPERPDARFHIVLEATATGATRRIFAHRMPHRYAEQFFIPLVSTA